MLQECQTHVSGNMVVRNDNIAVATGTGDDDQQQPRKCQVCLVGVIINYCCTNGRCSCSRFNQNGNKNSHDDNEQSNTGDNTYDINNSKQINNDKTDLAGPPKKKIKLSGMNINSNSKQHQIARQCEHFLIEHGEYIYIMKMTDHIHVMFVIV